MDEGWEIEKCQDNRNCRHDDRDEHGMVNGEGPADTPSGAFADDPVRVGCWSSGGLSDAMALQNRSLSAFGPRTSLAFSAAGHLILTCDVIILDINVINHKEISSERMDKKLEN